MSNYRLVDLDTNETLGRYDSYDQAADGKTMAYTRQYDAIDHMAIYPRAIDPTGCGCTECLTGEYVPLDQAGTVHVQDMLLGNLANHTHDQEVEIEAYVTIEGRHIRISGSVAGKFLSY